MAIKQDSFKETVTVASASLTPKAVGQGVDVETDYLKMFIQEQDESGYLLSGDGASRPLAVGSTEMDAITMRMDLLSRRIDVSLVTRYAAHNSLELLRSCVSSLAKMEVAPWW